MKLLPFHSKATTTTRTSWCSLSVRWNTCEEHSIERRRTITRGFARTSDISILPRGHRVPLRIASRSSPMDPSSTIFPFSSADRDGTSENGVDEFRGPRRVFFSFFFLKKKKKKTTRDERSLKRLRNDETTMNGDFAWWRDTSKGDKQAAR